MLSDTQPDRLRGVAERLRDSVVACQGGPSFAATPLTAADAADILNALPRRDLHGDSYVMVNVLNPDNTLAISGDRYVAARGREDHPLTGVTWSGARVIAAAAGGRLPTVPEWQHLLKLHGTAFPWGDDPPAPDRCNVDEHHGGTTGVFAFPPGSLGLRDLLGNVGEWCATDGRTSDEAAVVGGGWNKPVGAGWRRPRFKWKRIGTVAIGMRIVIPAA